MGLLSSVLGVLFGKEPAIFDESGQVRHKLPEKTWTNWQNKAKADPAHDWRHHNGTKAPKKK